MSRLELGTVARLNCWETWPGKGPRCPWRCPRGTCSHLRDQLRSGHPEEVTQAVPMASYERELQVPEGREQVGFNCKKGPLASVKPATNLIFIF